jgi:Holliday junction DNA helicase RuvA
MIGRLTGTLVSARAERVVIDVNGVGYEIAMTAKTISTLPSIGETVVVHTHLNVREDDLSLYGFASDADRDLFRILLGASGVGPKVALAMLGVFSGDALRKVVATEDVKALTQVPGVGMRGAQKIVLDLKPKLADLEADVVEGAVHASQFRDALEALGYTSAEIREIAPQIDAEAPVTEQIRHALRLLSTRSG